MSGKSALILGATGSTGKHVLRELLASPHFSRVGEFGRRVTPVDQLSGLETQNKLVQKTIDFEKVDQEGLKDGKWDVVFITLGTTRAQAGSAAAFEKIDREYVVNGARAALTGDPSHKQRVVYLSSTGADANSSFLYTKSKGLTENALAALRYSDTIIFRPGYLANAGRPQTRWAERLAEPIVKALSFVSPNAQIDVRVLAKAIVSAGHLGSDQLPAEAGAKKAGPPEAQFTVIANKGAVDLGAQKI